MTTSTAPPAPDSLEISLHRPGDIIAAIPHLVGFHPDDSIVAIALVGDECRHVRLTLRVDLPPPDQGADLARQLVPPVLAQQGSALLLAVVGGGEAGPGDRLPYRDVVLAMEQVFRSIGVPVLRAVWTEATRCGAVWRCYEDAEDIGTVSDPAASPMARSTQSCGLVTYDSREQLAATLVDTDDAAVVRRAVMLSQFVETGGGGVWPTVEHGQNLVRHAVGRMATKPFAPDDVDVVTLAVAMSDGEVRDTCFALTDGDTAWPAELLWSALTKATPVPYCAEPATLLAFASYVRGDGALASIALERAQLADPDHEMAGLLRKALDLGMPPQQLQRLATEPRPEPPQTAPPAET